MTGTRSGRAVLAAVLFIALAVIVGELFHADNIPPSWEGWCSVLPIVGTALAMIGLLGMTAEWTQRTALTTFTLSPRRGRVLGAKFLASVGLALTALFAVYVLIIAGIAAGSVIGGHPAEYSGVGRGVLSFGVIAVLQVTMAAGFGALSAQTALAVATYLVAPTIRAAVGDALFKSNAQWLDVLAAFGRLSSTHPFADFPQSLTSIASWIILQVSVGVVRSLKREVR